MFLTFFKIGLFSFGGGYAILAMIRQEVVLINPWLTQQEFMQVVAISQMTPGPIAINAATFVGYHKAGVLALCVHIRCGDAFLDRDGTDHYNLCKTKGIRVVQKDI